MDAVGWHSAWRQSEGFAVESGGVGEGAGGNEEVDVGYAGDHCGGVIVVG